MRETKHLNRNTTTLLQLVPQPRNICSYVYRYAPMSRYWRVFMQTCMKIRDQILKCVSRKHRSSQFLVQKGHHPHLFSQTEDETQVQIPLRTTTSTITGLRGFPDFECIPVFLLNIHKHKPDCVLSQAQIQLCKATRTNPIAYDYKHNYRSDRFLSIQFPFSSY